jgi:HK97 family phage prohead protease
MEADFSGYATKAGLKCSDGRTIMPDAFKHQDKMKVPLVWQHGHDTPDNVLGHVLLENRTDGVYGYGFFNDTPQGKSSKTLVEHGDVQFLSIWANQLVERSKQVFHGAIREVSLVLAGANPGAKIDYVRVAHSADDVEILEDEAIIHTGLPLEHETAPNVVEEIANAEEQEEDKEEKEEVVEHAADTNMDGDGPTAQEIYDSLTAQQKEVVHYMIGVAVESSATAKHSDTSTEHSEKTDDEGDLTHQEGTEDMKRNVFDQSDEKSNGQGTTLSHSDIVSIFEGAKRLGSIKEAVEDYALKHGIEDIETLFPDAKAVTNTPDFKKRRTEWVDSVMTETRHTPFSRIKSLMADLTLLEARAKGYVKGNLKQEEFFKVSKRVTTPQTIYKKQKLDRDDILDITDFDVVTWLKAEMRLMLEEEIARAILIGDGRSAGDDDKIKEDNVRPIATDDDLYITTLYVNLGDANSSAEEIVDALTLQRRNYRGSGNPTFYTSETILAQMLLLKDTLGRRIYPTVNDLAAALRVQKIVAVEVMDEPANTVVGILVNLADYTIGADRGGDVSLFDDFDIDYNQYKYLIETRMSGALTKWKSALVVRKTAASDVQAVPVAPTWDGTAHTVTVATTTGITYKNKLTNVTLVTGSPVTLAPGDELTVIAIANAGYYIASSADDEFLFNYDDGLVGTA